MGTIAKCNKCNKEHDLSLAQCPAPAASRVLPPTGPKPSPSTSVEAKKVEAKPEEPIKVEVPKLTGMKSEPKQEVIAPVVVVDSVDKTVIEPIKDATLVTKQESKPKLEAQPEAPKPPVLPARQDSAQIEMPAVVTPSASPSKDTIPSSAKTSSPSLEALAATLEANKPAPKSDPKKETVVSGEAFVMPPQSPKDKAMMMIKGKEKFVAAGAGVLLVLILIVAFSGKEETKTTAAAAPTKESSLFQPTSDAASQATVEAIDDEGGDPAVAVGTNVPLEVNVTPAEAVIIVWVDGEIADKGASPLTTEVPVGASVEVTLAAAGYSPEQKTFKAKGKKTINESLSKIGTKTSNTGGGAKTSSGGNKGGWGWGGK